MAAVVHRLSSWRACFSPRGANAVQRGPPFSQALSAGVPRRGDTCTAHLQRTGSPRSVSVTAAPSSVSVLCDVEGVLVSGNEALPGAVETVQWMVDAEVPHLFLTNTATTTTEGLVRKLSGLGIPCDAGGILTPASATCSWLQKNNKERIALFTSDSLHPEFRELRPITAPKDDAEVDAVVVADMGDNWSYERLNTIFRLLMTNPDAALISLGKTKYFKDKGGGLSLDVGPFTAAMEFATGREAVVLGKPDAAFFEMGVARLGMGAEGAVMVGDDVQGDVGGAQGSGMRGVLVKTGKYMEGDLERGVRPDGVIDSIGDLPSLLSSFE